MKVFFQKRTELELDLYVFIDYDITMIIKGTLFAKIVNFCYP